MCHVLLNVEFSNACFSGFAISTVYQYTQQRSIIGTLDTVGLLLSPSSDNNQNCRNYFQNCRNYLIYKILKSSS